MNGSIGLALKWKENEELYNQIEEFFEKIKTKDEIDLLNNQSVIYKNKESIIEIIAYMNTLFFREMKNPNNINDIAKYVKCIEILENNKKKLKANGNFDICVDNMLLSMHDALN